MVTLLLALHGAGGPASQESAAVGAAPEAQLRAPSAAAVSLQSEEKLHQAFEHLYNLEFREAYGLFQEVAEAEPESATVRAFWASALLYQILAQQGSLQSQLFVTSNDFLRFERTPPDPKLKQEFDQQTAETRALAEKRLRANRADPDALFALGLSYGNQANYLAGAEAEYFAGLRTGEKAYDINQKLRKLHPELHDTAVVLGVRDYVIASLPRAHQFFLFFLGARGSRERGLAYLEEAAEKGEYLQTYAQMLLVVAYIRAGDLERALALGFELRDRYPHNPVFALEIAKLYRQLERYPDAKQVASHLLAEVIAHPHNPRIVGPEEALFELGLIEWAEGNHERALEALEQVDTISDSSRRVAAAALLERGKIYDELGQREKALAEYERVVGLGSDRETTRLAQAYQKRPYRQQEKR